MSGRKQREVYVGEAPIFVPSHRALQEAQTDCPHTPAGNLTLGVVTDMMLRELFNGALAHLVPNPQTNPPVVNAQLDPTGELQTCPSLSLMLCSSSRQTDLSAAGRFGFVEMRTEELATSAMQLDKVSVSWRAHFHCGLPHLQCYNVACEQPVHLRLPAALHRSGVRSHGPLPVGYNCRWKSVGGQSTWAGREGTWSRLQVQWPPTWGPPRCLQPLWPTSPRAACCWTTC